jgi:hypothetical protein
MVRREDGWIEQQQSLGGRWTMKGKEGEALRI